MAYFSGGTGQSLKTQYQLSDENKSFFFFLRQRYRIMRKERWIGILP